MNNVIDDIVDDLNNPRPVAAGGTGVTSLGALRSALNVAEQVSGGADTTAGRGLVVGSMGVGGFGLTAADFNTSVGVTATIKSNTASAGNAPDAGNVWVGDQWAKNSNSAAQVMADVADGRLMFRVKDGGTWDTTWKHVRVVEQVSDDGLGNICWRYSDGYQECQWHGAVMSCDTANGSGWRSSNETWTYQLAFVGSHPDVQVTARRTSTSTSPPWAMLVNSTGTTDDAVTTTRAIGTMMSFAEGAFGKIMYKATGYWR